MRWAESDPSTPSLLSRRERSGFNVKALWQFASHSGAFQAGRVSSLGALLSPESSCPDVRVGAGKGKGQDLVAPCSVVHLELNWEGGAP